MIKPQRLSRSVIYESPWVNLYADRVRFPQGRIIERHHVLEFDKEAVAAIVVNNQAEILLAQVYRYVTDELCWEIPAGGIDAGEDIITAGQREVLEETGYETINPELIYTYHPSNGIANQVFHIIRCQAATNRGEFDGNEVKAVRWFSRSEIEARLANRSITDGYTLTGLLLELRR